MNQPTAPLVTHTVRPAEHVSAPWDLCTLTYDERYVRRKVYHTAQDRAFLVDLERTTSVDHGDAFELTDGRLIKVIAADEALFEITSPDLIRVAWHIGNRHTPCQIDADRLVILRDPVMASMLQHLGAQVREIVEPFTPEGGAYGHGRTHAHEHGNTLHTHAHDP